LSRASPMTTTKGTAAWLRPRCAFATHPRVSPTDDDDNDRNHDEEALRLGHPNSCTSKRRQECEEVPDGDKGQR